MAIDKMWLSWLEADPKNPVFSGEKTSSCTAKLSTELAEHDFEQFSESDQVVWAEHVSTCSACECLIKEHKMIQEVFRVLSSPQRSPGETMLKLPPSILRDLQAAGYHSDEQGNIVKGKKAVLLSFPQKKQATDWRMKWQENFGSKLLNAFIRLLGRLVCK